MGYPLEAQVLRGPLRLRASAVNRSTSPSHAAHCTPALLIDDPHPARHRELEGLRPEAPVGLDPGEGQGAPLAALLAHLDAAGEGVEVSSQTVASVKGSERSSGVSATTSTERPATASLRR